MARVTIEDCLKHEPNHFELVIKAAERARKLARGEADATIDWNKDKSTVIALKEFALGKLTESSEEE